MINTHSILSTHVTVQLTVTVYGPAKSRMTPALVQMPMCPMKGSIHLKGGGGRGGEGRGGEGRGGGGA